MTPGNPQPSYIRSLHRGFGIPALCARFYCVRQIVFQSAHVYLFPLLSLSLQRTGIEHEVSPAYPLLPYFCTSIIDKWTMYWLNKGEDTFLTHEVRAGSFPEYVPAVLQPLMML